MSAAEEMSAAEDMADAVTNCRRESFRDICSLPADRFAALSFWFRVPPSALRSEKRRKPIVIFSMRSGQNGRSENYIVRLWAGGSRALSRNATLKLLLAQAI